MHSGVEVVSTTFRPERARYGEGAAAAAAPTTTTENVPKAILTSNCRLT